MSKISVESVQDWLDESDIWCGGCGDGSLTVLDIENESLISEEFDDLSSYVAVLECDDCGSETSNRLKRSVVETIKE